MVLDGPVQYEPPEQKPYVSLIAKKRSLDTPAKILLMGAEHLRNLQVNTRSILLNVYGEKGLTFAGRERAGRLL